MKRMCVSLLLSTLIIAPVCAAQPTRAHAHEGGLPESPAVNIPYKSPAAALAAVRAKPGVVTDEQEEWFVLSDAAENALWSITKPDHFAHPTAVLRRAYVQDGQVMIGMDVKCGSAKANCDRVVQQFIELNETMRKQHKDN